MSLKLGKLKIGGKHGIEIGGHSVNPADIANEAVDRIHGLANDALHEVESAGNTVLHEVESRANDALHEVESKGRNSLHVLESAGNTVLHEVESRANDALHEIEGGLANLRDEIFKGLAKLSLDKAVNILEATVPDSFSVTIGPFIIAYEDPASKIDTLRRYAHNPPGLDNVTDLVLALAPTTVSVCLSAELAFLLVSSDSLAVGFQADYTVENFISRYDKIRHQLGI